MMQIMFKHFRPQKRIIQQTAILPVSQRAFSTGNAAIFEEAMKSFAENNLEMDYDVVE